MVIVFVDEVQSLKGKKGLEEKKRISDRDERIEDSSRNKEPLNQLRNYHNGLLIGRQNRGQTASDTLKIYILLLDLRSVAKFRWTTSFEESERC